MSYQEEVCRKSILTNPSNCSEETVEDLELKLISPCEACTCNMCD